MNNRGKRGCRYSEEGKARVRKKIEVKPKKSSLLPTFTRLVECFRQLLWFSEIEKRKSVIARTNVCGQLSYFCFHGTRIFKSLKLLSLCLSLSLTHVHCFRIHFSFVWLCFHYRTQRTYIQSCHKIGNQGK